MANEYFIGSGAKYFQESPSYNVDRKLEEPISAKPVEQRRGFAPGTDPGGPLTAGLIGVTSNPMEHQTRAMQAAIKLGASRIELGAMGTGKGSSQAPTPESFGKEEREEMRNLARINKVETTFHAAPSVSMLSGLTQQGFSEQARMDALNEIKKAVDFAAEASTGGAVVLHYDEWERPIEERYGLDKNEVRDGKKKHAFQGYAGEFLSERDKDGNLIDPRDKSGYGGSAVMFVDMDSKQVQSIKRDMEFVEPIITGVEYVPEDDPRAEFVEYNRKTREPEQKRKAFFKYKYAGEDSGDDTEAFKSETLYYDDIIAKEREMNNGSTDSFKDNVRYMQENFKPLYSKWQEIEKQYQDAKEGGSKLDLNKVKDEIFLFHFLRQRAYQSYDQFISAENYYKRFSEDPKQEEHNRERMRRAWADFEKQMDSVNKFKPIDEYGMEKSALTIAQAAMYARERSQGNKGLSRNLYVAPESVFPEKFGSHPDEMKQVIDKSREQMVKQLETSLGKEEAKKEAAKYIKATFDIGHMNMWRRHFIRKDGESNEDYNKRFNEWALTKSKELADEGYIGHVHMSDNFGFSDEHLSVGQGNAPIQEFVKNMRDSGKVDDFIVEVGSFNAQTALGDAWAHLGAGLKSSYLSSGAPSPNVRYFGNARNSYFGHTRRPSYVYGKYVPVIPGEKWQGWSPWTGSPI